MLVIEREIERQPRGRHLEAILYLVVHVGNTRIRRYLPALFQVARSQRERYRVMQAMADLHGHESIRFIEQFLSEADAQTPECLLCEAARGLGLTGRRKFQPLLRRAATLVQSPEARLRMAAARWRCGDPTAGRAILTVLQDEEAGRELRLWALDFLVENALPEAAPVLTDIAGESKDDEIGTRALRALIRATGYAKPPGNELLAMGGKDTPVEMMEMADAELEADPALAWAEEDLKVSERKRMVRLIVVWRAEHPLAGMESGGADGRGPGDLPDR